MRKITRDTFKAVKSAARHLTTKGKNMAYICHGSEREGRYFSEEFGLWYDVYPCEAHGFHVDVDHDKEW